MLSGFAIRHPGQRRVNPASNINIGGEKNV